MLTSVVWGFEPGNDRCGYRIPRDGLCSEDLGIPRMLCSELHAGGSCTRCRLRCVRWVLLADGTESDVLDSLGQWLEILESL